MGFEFDPNSLIPCNSTMAALVDSAVGLDNQQISFEQLFSAGYCQYVDNNSTLAAEAKEVWIKGNSYGYVPSSGFGLFAIIMFGISLCLHTYQLFRSRRWSYIAVVCGAALQIFGWAERYSAANNLTIGYVEQLAVLTIAPTFFSAAMYTLFSLLTATEGPDLLPLMKPRGYMWTFIVIDFCTLVIQAAGGAIAAITDDRTVFRTGCNIMLAGIVLQFVTTLAFVSVFAIFFRRLRAERGKGVFSLRTGTGVVFTGTVLMALFIIIRGCYRIAELSEGLFTGIASNQVALIACDCFPMLIVIYLLNWTHPLHTIKPPVSAASYARTESHSLEKLGGSGAAMGEQQQGEQRPGYGQAAQWETYRRV
ncbi:hypothetical protein JCM10207_008335 [Rhodosporidiobolus poonsookiae]